MIIYRFVETLCARIWVKEKSLDDVIDEQIVDVREDAYCLNECTHIPYGYPLRLMYMLGERPLHIVGESRLEINLSIRFLQKRGFKVASFTKIETSKELALKEA